MLFRSCDGAASFLQSGFWGAFKALFGWKAFAFRTVWNSAAGGEEKPLMVLHRSLARDLFSMAYVPWGPELPAVFRPQGMSTDKSAEISGGDEGRWSALKDLAAALRKQLPSGTAFIRFDPPWFIESPDFSPPAPFVRSGADIQPPDTVLIDISRPMETVIGEMKPKWRYNARRALKKGVTVRRAEASEAEVFYGLLEETARRDGIAVHSFDYYRTLLENNWYGGVKPESRLYLAEHEGDTLAGIVTLFRGREAVYLYGSSSDKKRNLMAPYALQLKAMEDAKEAGCEVYDLFGIPPDDDPAHPMSGLFRFKTGFGGKIVHRPGSSDYPCRPLIYRLFRCAETLRKKMRTLKKQKRKQRTEPAHQADESGERQGAES